MTAEPSQMDPLELDAGGGPSLSYRKEVAPRCFLWVTASCCRLYSKQRGAEEVLGRRARVYEHASAAEGGAPEAAIPLKKVRARGRSERRSPAPVRAGAGRCGRSHRP